MSITTAKITIILGLLAIYGLYRLDRFLTKRRNLRRKTKFYKSEAEAERASKAWYRFLCDVKKGTMVYDLKNGTFVEFIKVSPNIMKAKGYVAVVQSYETNKPYAIDILNIEVATTLDYMRVKRAKKDKKC